MVDNECYILQSQSDATIIIDQQKYDNATVNRASRKVIYYSHMHKSNLVENIWKVCRIHIILCINVNL